MRLLVDLLVGAAGSGIAYYTIKGIERYRYGELSEAVSVRSSS
jgi:hypothetical protein